MDQRVGSLRELSERLTAEDVPHELHPGQLWLPVRHASFEATAMVLWPQDLSLVQVIVPLPFAVPEEAALTMSDALTRLNHASIVPGFGLDHEHRQPYYRLVQPRDPQQGFAMADLQRMLSAAVRSAAQFGPRLAAVLAGEVDPKDVAD